MSVIHEELCNLAGICEAPWALTTTTSTTAPTTEVSTSTTTSTIAYETSPPNSKPTDEFVKLTSEENDKRLRTCGNEKLERKATDDNYIEVNFFVKWLVTVKNVENIEPFLATMISSRNVLLPAYPVQKFSWINQKIHEMNTQCDENNEHRFFPKQLLTHLEVRSIFCGQKYNGNCPRIQLSSAYILDGCRNVPINKSMLLIATIENGYPENTSHPCLADENTINQSDGLFDLYESTKNWHRHMSLMSTNTSDDSFYVDFYIHYGIVTKIINDKETLFGIGLMYDGGAKKITHYSDVICKLAGICSQFSNGTQFPHNSNDPSSISKVTTLSFNSTQPTITKNITPVDAKVVEELDEDVEATTEDDGNIDNDLVVSMDFLDGVGHRIGIIELVVILIGILLSQLI